MECSDKWYDRSSQINALFHSVCVCVCVQMSPTVEQAMGESCIDIDQGATVASAASIMAVPNNQSHLDVTDF